MAAETTEAFVAGARPHKRTSRTPVDALPLPKDESAEILVSRDQHSLRVLTLTQNGFIHDPRRHLGHVGNLVAIESKAFDNLTVDALISEESLRGDVSTGYMTSARLVSRDQLNSNAGTRDHRFAHHHVWIGKNHVLVNRAHVP